MIKITGHKHVIQGLDQILDNIEDPEIITEDLAEGMRKYVHVQTGYLKSTIYYKHNVAGADAPYAGHEAARGGEHNFPQKAIDAFDINKYADNIVKDW